MNILLGVIVGIIVLTLIVTAHEFGHFIMAKRSGVKVNEFGIGFPPKAVTWLHIPASKAKEYCKKFKYNENRSAKIINKAQKALKKEGKKTKYIWIPLPKSEWYEETSEGLAPKKQDYLIFSLNYLPIGGFCQMDGESDADTRKGTFGSVSYWKKTKILFGGVAMNWLLAFIILTVLAWTGMPKFIDNQYFIESDIHVNGYPVEVVDVIDGSPASAAGIISGNYIGGAWADDQKLEIIDTTELIAFNQKHADSYVTYAVFNTIEDYQNLKNSNCGTVLTNLPVSNCDFVKTVTLKLNSTNEDYLLGISMTNTSQTLYSATWSAPIVGAVQTVQLTGETFRGLGTMIYNLFSGFFEQFSSNEVTRTEAHDKLSAAGDSVTGPVGIIGILFPAFTSAGITNIAFLAAIISISLACMNVLPIPALDGGRWMLITLFRARKKKLSTEIEGKIVARAMIVILLLAVIITVLDVIKLVR